MYCIGLTVLLLGICVSIFSFAAPELFRKILFPCPVHFLTGLYCPGCGGTRALLYLLHGDIKNSVIHHPAVLYLFCVGSVFMVSQTIARFHCGRTWAMRYKNCYLYILVGLYVLNFIWKNAALLVFHMRIIA